MTQWIQTSNTKQDGTPVTRAIKISGMGEQIFFTDSAYAEISDDVADLLASQIDEISKVSEPASPGTYYGDAGQNTTIQIVLPDNAFDHFTAESGDVDALTTEKRISIFRGGHAKTTEPLFHNKDTDGSTPLDWDVSVGGFPLYIIELPFFGNDSGSGDYKSVKLNYNNQSKNLTSVFNDDSTRTATTWEDENYSQSRAFFNWAVYDDKILFSDGFVSDSDRGHSVRGFSSGHNGSNRLVEGYSNNTAKPIKSIQVSTEFEATGQISIIGVRL
jgi:hypothetical protein